MNGSGGNPQGQLRSTMTFATGNYLLSFDLVGSQRGVTASVTVTLGNYNQTFTLASGDDSGGILVNAPVTVTTAGQLMFVSNTAGDEGLLLDDVAVNTSAISGVPEPSSELLMGAGLLAAACALARWRSNSAH